MDFELYHKYPPGDPTLVEKIVCHLKAQGIFDNFRKECLSDVDTKPAYQNLRQRVDGSVAGYLSAYKWRPDLNKNQLRENLRKYIQNGGFLEVGVERIVDQVVNPKIGQVFLPKVREVVLEGLGLKKDRDRNSSDRPASCSYMPSSTFTSASIPNQTDDSKGTVELDKELVSSNESEVKKEDNGSENVVHSEEVVTSQVDSEPECVIEEAVIPLDNLNETQSNDSYESHISGMSDLTSVKSNNSCDDDDDDDDDDNPLNTDAEKEGEHDADNIAGSMTSVNGGGDNSQNESNMLSNVNYEGAFSDFSFSTEFTTHVENIEIETGQIGTTEVECVTTENNEEDNDRMSPNVITESIQPNYDSDSNGKYKESQQLTEIEYDSVSDKGDEDEDENVYDESSRGLNSGHKEESHFEESQSETDVERLDSTSNEIKFSENTNYFDDSKLEKSSEDESYNRSSHDENEELEKEITYKKDKERKHHSKHKHTKNHHSNSSSGESREDRKHRKSSHSKDKHRHNRDFDKHGSNGEDKSRRTDSKHRRLRGCEVEEQEEATSTYIQEETSRSGSDKKSKYSEKVSRRSHKSRYSHSRDYEDVIAGSYEEEDDETNEYQENVKYSRKDKKSKDRRKTSREKIYDSEFEETAFDHEEASRSESDENKVYKETLNYSQEENYTRTRDSKKVLEEEYEYGEITTDHGEESRCESEEEIRYKEKDKFSHKQKHIRSRDRKKANEDHYKYEGMSSDQEEANKSESEEINVYKKKVKYSHGEKHTRSKDRKKSSKKETLEYRNEISKFDHEEQSKSESDEKNVYKEKNKYSYEEPHCRSRVRRKTFKEDFVYGEITSDHEESSRSESDEKDVLKANIRFSHEEKLTRSRDYKKATEDEEQDFEYEESKFDKSEFDDEENEYEEGIGTKKERSSRSRRHKSAADKKLDEDDQEETKRDRKEKRRRSQKGESKEDSHSDQYEKAIFDQHEPNESEIDEKNNYQEDNSHKERHSRSRDHKNVFKEKTQDGSHKQKREGQSHHRSDSDKEKHYSSSRSKHSTSEDDVKKGKSHKSSSSFGEHKSSHHRSSRDKHATKESENYDLEEKHRIKDDKVRKDKGSSRKKRESCKPADKSREHRRSADRDRDSSGAGESRSQVGAGAVAGVSHNSNTKQTRSTGKGSKNSSTSDATQLQQSQLFSTNINQGECVEAVVQPSFSTLDSLMNDSRIHLADNVVVTANEIVSESEENTQICQEKTEDEAGGKTEDEAGGKSEDEVGGKTEDEARGKTEDEVGGKTEDEAGGKTEDEAGGKTEDEAGGKTEDEVGGKTEDVDSKEQNKHNREVHEMSTGDIGKKNTEEESQASKSKLFQLDDLNPSIINPAPNTQEIIRNKENYEGHEKLISDYQVVGEDIVVLGNNSDVQQDEESNRLQGNEGINPDHQNLETVVSTQNIETQLPKDDQKKFRKKRFAANIAEVRKIMRERRRNEKIQKKRSSVEDSAANDHPSITDPSIDNQTQMQKHDIDEIETTVESNKDISVPDLTESSFENSAGCIQGTSCNNDVLPLPQNELNNFKYKRPKFAANIYEVRKIIKARKRLRRMEKKRFNSSNLDLNQQSLRDNSKSSIEDSKENGDKVESIHLENECDNKSSTYAKIARNQLGTRVAKVVLNRLEYDSASYNKEENKSEKLITLKIESQEIDGSETKNFECKSSLSYQDINQLASKCLVVKLSKLDEDSLKKNVDVVNNSITDKTDDLEDAELSFQEDKIPNREESVSDADTIEDCSSLITNERTSIDPKLHNLEAEQIEDTDLPNRESEITNEDSSTSKTSTAEDEEIHSCSQSECVLETPDPSKTGDLNELDNNFTLEKSKFITKATVVANSNESETIDSTIDMTSAGSCDLNELENFILEKLESISKAIDVEISNESETIDSTYDTSDSGSKPGDSNELDAILTLEKSEAKSEVIDVKNSNESETIDSTVDMTSSDELPNSIDNVPDFEIATEKNGILDQTTQIYSDNNAKSIKEVENLPASVTLNEVLESSSLITLKPAAIPKLEESNSATESDLFARETSIFDSSSPLRGFDVDLSESLSTIYNRKIETYSSEGYEENVPSNDFVENENDETHTFISFDQRETEIAKEKLEKLKKCLEVYEKEYKSLKYLEKTELVTSDFLLDKQFDSYLEKECGLQVLRKDCIRLPPLNDENYYLDEEDGCYHLKNKPIDSSKVRKENMETLVEQIEVSRPVQSSEKKSVRVRSEKKSPVKLRISIRNPNSSAIETEEIDVPYTWDVESSTDGSTARTSVDSRNSVEDVESEQPTSTHCDVESEQPTSTHCDVESEQPTPTHCDVESEQPTPTHCDVESDQPTPTHCDVESEQPTPTHCDVSATQAQIATQALQAHVETVQPFTNQVPHLANPKKKRSRKRSFNSTNIVTREFKIKTCPEAENNNLPSAHLNSFKITLSRNNSNLSRIITPQSPSSQSNNFSANKILNSSDAAIPSESENSFVVDKRHTSITDSVQESRCSHSPKKWFDEDLDDTDQGIETITDYLNNSFEEEADESMASKMIGEALKNLIAESGLTTRTQSPPSYQETKESARITRQQRNRNSIVEPENTVSPPKKLRNSERLSAGVKIPKRYENTDLYKPRLDSGNRRKRKADEPALDSLVDNEPRKRRLRATV